MGKTRYRQITDIFAEASCEPRVLDAANRLTDAEFRQRSSPGANGFRVCSVRGHELNFAAYYLTFFFRLDIRAEEVRGVTTAKGLRTRETILDAAELLFANHGFDGVTVRDVGKQAKLLTGHITYHFPTKDILFKEVVQRRAKELNDLRRKMLTRIDNDARQVLLALARPYLDKILSGDEGWRNYARLGVHLSSDRRWADLSDHLFGDVARLLIRALRNAEPRLSAEAATRAYVHSMAVMLSVYSSSNLLDRFSGGRLHSDDIEASFEPMIQFLLGGIQAYCHPDFGRDSHNIPSAGVPEQANTA